MQKLMLLLCAAVSASAQQLVSATPAPFVGTSGTVSFTIAGGASPLHTYYLTFVAPALTQYLQPNLVPSNDCVVIVHYNAPGYAYASLAPDYGGGWYNDVGSYTGLEAGTAFYPPTVSNSFCTIHGMADGSSVQVPGDGSLRINLKMDFNFSNFSGTKYLYFGYRDNYGPGPYWVGPLVQNGVISTWNIGTRAKGLTNGNDTFGSLVDNVAPSILFENTTAPRTDQNTYFVEADSYHFKLTGPPNAPVVVTRTQNGASASTLYLSLDSTGTWEYYGVIAANEVGFWTEVWNIAGYNTPMLSMTVAAAGSTRAQMISPANGSTLPGSTVTFSWAAGAGAQAYWLDVGTVFTQGNIYAVQLTPSVTSQTVSGIPTGGMPIYVRLWTLLNGTWQVNDYTYTAH